MCSADILLRPFCYETKYMFPLRSRLPYLCPRQVWYTYCMLTSVRFVPANVFMHILFM